MKKIIILLALIQTLFAQNVPFVTDHPIYHFFDRQEALGNINSEFWSTRPYTYIQINDMLSELENNRSTLSESDLRILARFQQEFSREFEEGITFPWNTSKLKGLRSQQKQVTKPFFMTYQQDSTKGWINWSETFRIQNNGTSSRGYYTDHLGIYGQKGAISFTSQFTYHRATKNDDFDELPESYKEGYLLERDYLKWVNWDYTTSSLTYTHKDFNLGIHRQPIYWGYSAANSPIISDNVYPLPHIQWSTRTSHLRYVFVHARLSPNEALVVDTLNVRRNLSAHRVEFDISPNFEFAFNEMIIYAHRDFELGYLNPVNFFFTEEHVQGDLDNLLMALDFKWRLGTGLTTYGTWFFDELHWFNLFSGWWGNKFVFQLGASYFPKANLPAFNIEYTAARPWTYSHKFPVNSFTSAGRVLGLQAGPNTQSLHFGLDWQVDPKLNLHGTLDFLTRGDDLGADPLNSYLLRGDFEEDDESFIVGDLQESTRWGFSANYYIQPTTIVKFSVANENLYELGIKLDW